MTNPATYTPTYGGGWQTGSGGGTPITAAALQDIDAGLQTLYANAGQTGGANAWTGLQTDQVTLSGSDKKVHTYKATDGKTFSLYIRSNNHVALHNDTDNVWIWDFEPMTGAVSFDTGNFTSDGSGIISVKNVNLASGGSIINTSSGAGINFAESSSIFGVLIPNGGWCELNGVASNSGVRIAGGGSVIARFQTGATGLIVNQGFQFGSGGADNAELFWSDDASLGPGDVVRVVEDAAHGGKIVRCEQEAFAGALIISTAPASLHGGEVVEVPEQRHILVPVLDAHGQPQRDGAGHPLGNLQTIEVLVTQPSTDPHWKPVAMDGRIPVKASGDLSQYVAGETFLVSTANGTARPARDGERGRWLCVSTLSDVGKRPLAPGCVLALVV